MTGHRWDVSPKEARSLQEGLRSRRILTDSFDPLTHVGGVDVAYDLKSDLGCCAIAVFSYPHLCLQEVSRVFGSIRFPYIPGLLAFREGPLVEQAFGQLTIRPEILLFDGHGISHPRGMGIATYMGILLECASIGCAKTLLTDTFEDPAPKRGSATPVIRHGEIVGCALRTRTGVNPVFVSQGHRVSLDTSVEICLACTPKYRIPEPLRAAHLMARQAVRSLASHDRHDGPS
ncbi:MAG TPA: endonuclease V [Deltaproteobacteria bacterium]|nr:endonuclease V [Deltaproteobacteria bacterium]